ncbi:MAG: peptidoglycan DD-metalloendopeptidase family protein [Rhodobacteraceae bacterium]|nr:peptidoglycan DD-metalloendopeptidase family protein [Paracoccaceae bacterium]
MAVSVNNTRFPLALLLSGGLLLNGCGDFSFGDFRDTIDPVPGQTAAQSSPRPKPDSRGVITYPHYQVIVAKRGDSMADVAGRVGMSTEELARYNGLPVTHRPRAGEVLALPKGVIIPTEGTGTTDLENIATTAIANAQTGVVQEGPEPIRHVVESGETAYSIARLYGVSVTSLASWNGLDRDLSVREGQRLLIPVVEDGTPADQETAEAAPGTGSETPLPPSSTDPLPETVVVAEVPESPNLVEDRTPPGANRKLLTPVSGKIVRGYSTAPGGNEGLDIAAASGSSVKAAEDGEVALISSSSSSNTIVLIRHPDNLYTVYSNVSDVSVKKGQTVSRGQGIAKVASGDSPFLHFEIRRGTESVDPTPYL